MKQFLPGSFYRLKATVFLVGLVLFLVPLVGNGQIIISQVYEGLSNDKWIEITNIGTTTVNLASPQLKIGIYTKSSDTGNGGIAGITPTTLNLSGSLSAGQSLLLKNTSAANPTYASGTGNTTVNAFNGNDALALLNSSNSIIDLFGDGINNKDLSYHRNSSISTTNATFTVSEWTTKTLTEVANATTSNSERLGVHIFSSVSNPTISAATLTGTSPYCEGSGFTASFTTTGTFNAGNTFSAQLSDASGLFGSPTTIGTSTTAGNISVTLPNGVSGSGYKIRVVSSDPVVTGSASSAFSIATIPASNIPSLSSVNSQLITTNSTGTAITASTTAASGFSWQYATVSGGPYTAIGGATNATYTPNGAHFPGANTYYLVAIATSTCGSVTGTSSEITITVDQGTSLTSQITAVAASEAATISSMFNHNPITSNSEGTPVWQFTLTDGDGNADDSDNLPTIYKAFVINTNTGNTVSDWSAVIADAQLFDMSTGNLIPATIAVATNSITFTPGTAITIADGTTGFKTIGIRLSLKPTLPTNSDDKIFTFKLTNSNTTVETSSLSSQLGAFSIVSDNTKNKIDVTATKLRFVQQPTNVLTNVAISPAVTIEATDANNNRDLGFNTALEITATGATLNGSPVSAVATNGLATFSSLTFSTAGTGVTLSGSRSTSNDWTITSNPFNVTNAAPAITVKQGTNALPNGGTYNFATSIAVGANGTAIAFTIGNTGNADLTNVVATVTGDFEITNTPATSVPVGSTTITVNVRFKPTAVGSRTGTLTITSNDAAQSPYVINLSGNGIPNSVSDIIATTGFTYATNINYSQYQSATINALTDGLPVFGFTLRDGGFSANDADNLPTTLESIAFSSVQNSGAIRAAAIFKGAALIAFTNNIGSTISFTGLPTTGATALTASDNSAENYTLVVTFTNTVTDNSQLRFTVTKANSVTAGNNESSSFSNFTSILSSIANNNNRLTVTATTIAWDVQPLDGEVNVNLNAFSVKAVDPLGNTDLDANCTITLSSAGAGFTSGASYTFTSGITTVSNARFSSLQNGVTITATAASCLNNAVIVSNPFNIVSLAIVSGDYRSNGGGTSIANATWERYNGTTWATSGAPTTNVFPNTVYIRHAIQSGSIAQSKVVVLSGGSLTITGASTIDNKLSVKSGGTLEVQKNADLTNATFTIEDGGTAILNVSTSPKMTSGSTFWAGTENFYPNSTVIVKDWDYVSGSGANRIYDNNISANDAGFLFGNLTIDATPNGSGVTSFVLVQGNVAVKLAQNTLTIINNAASLPVNLNNSTADIEIGNIIHSKGNFNLYASAGTPALTINGNFESAMGTVNMNTTNNGSAAVSMNIKGNFKVLATSTFTSTDAGSVVNLNGTALQQLDVAAALASVNVIYNVKSGAQVQLVNRNLTINSSALTVENGATLDFNGYNITGTGSLTLANGGTLKITDAAGIAPQGTTAGNVQTTTRNYGNSKYIYSGAVAQQSGNGLPASVEALTIDNLAGVTLTSSTEATSLVLNHGKLTTTLNNKVTVAAVGNITAPEPSSYVEGPLAFKVTAAKTLVFPIGKNGNSLPVTLDIQSQDAGENIYTAEQFEKAYVPATSNLPQDVTHISRVRYFTISKGGSANVTATIRLTYQADDMITDPSKLTIIKYNPSGVEDLFASATGTNTGGTITSVPFTSFSDFVLANKTGGNNPLPVELLSFTAQNRENNVILNWVTASEKNSQRFEIERSLNGINFEKIGEQEAAGNSNVEKRYAFTDKNPVNGTAYYRLKQVDWDGTFTYSAILSVKTDAVNFAVKVYPNPATHKLTVSSGKTEMAAVRIINNLGQVVMEKTEGSSTEKVLDISTLPAGSYQVLVLGKEFQTVKRFVKID